MNRKIIFILLVIVILLGCDHSKQVNHNSKGMHFITKVSEDGKVQSEGYVNTLGQRDSLWEYKNELDELVARGSYINGLKKGEWVYGINTYNRKKNIIWDKVQTSLFIMNLPIDWEIINLSKQSLHLFQAEFKESSSINIFILEREGKTLNMMKNEVIKRNMSQKKYELLEEKKIDINGFEAWRIIQKINLNKKLRDVEQYLILSNKTGNVFLISFFTLINEDTLLFHKLFTEIAFSFKEKEVK